MLNKNQVIELRESLNNKGYCQVNNVLHPELKKYLQIGSYILENQSSKENDTKEDVVHTKSTNSKVMYSSNLGESLLVYFTEIYSKISGKNLIPTYSFYRKYYKTNILLPHKDRPSCQYSATIQINSSVDKSWNFFLKDKQGQKVECKTKVGDIIFYKGQEVEHWREELEYEHSSHFFLHWVDKDDPQYKKHWFDGRSGLGILR